MKISEKAGYGEYKASADYISSRIGGRPDVAVILGSGLGGFAALLSDCTAIPYREIPNFPFSTAPFQKGELVFGSFAGKKVLAMNGRFHYYEGWEMWQTAYPIAVMKLLGIENLIITNAAGGVSEKLNPGDLVLVRDHIKLSAQSPDRGQNIGEFGTRFFDMQNVYDKNLADLALKAAGRLGFELKEGVYAYMSGPQYETPAEVRMLRMLGADLVGMSTVSEIIEAAHCGIKALCISCVSNMAAGITGKAIDENEVVETGKMVTEHLTALVCEVLKNV